MFNLGPNYRRIVQATQPELPGGTLSSVRADLRVYHLHPFILLVAFWGGMLEDQRAEVLYGFRLRTLTRRMAISAATRLLRLRPWGKLNIKAAANILSIRDHHTMPSYVSRQRLNQLTLSLSLKMREPCFLNDGAYRAGTWQQ